MREDLMLTVGGVPLQVIGYWGEPVLTWRRRGGSWECTWKMDLPINFRHPALVIGAEVAAVVGGVTIWRGDLAETNWDDREFIAIGRCRQAETAIALDFGTATSSPSAAVGWGILRSRLKWNGLNTLPTTPIAADSDNGPLNMIADLLDAWAKSAGVEWWVAADVPALFSAPPPTAPLWSLTPGAAVLGIADEDYVSDLYGRYTPRYGTLATAEAHDTTQNVGRVERAVDLTPRGVLTHAQATAILNGILDKTRARTGWTNSLEVSYGQILTPGGTPAALSHVASTPNQMVRLLGIYDERGAQVTTDVVIDETIWTAHEGRLELKPAGLADRDLASIVEAAGGELMQ